jgi:hypothetical protein
MWPRALFDLPTTEGGGKLTKRFPILGKSGVYILYRDDIPYYIGQATKLITRLKVHHKPGARYSLFWNYFSVFALDTQEEMDKIEAILITVFPTVNGAIPRIAREKLPKDVIDLMRRMRRNQIGISSDEDDGTEE